MKSFSYKLVARDKKTKARAGEVLTPHGIIQTPAFVPVGTQATVKSLTPLDLKGIGAQVLFANTYHLHLRPGEDMVKKFGGLGRFMGWRGPTMTDSGGFQVFSLAGRASRLPHAPDDAYHSQAPIFDKDVLQLVKITDNGVEFRSHLDGSLHYFTPEKSIEIQQSLGADIILAFDECAPYPSTYEYTKKAMERIHNWALRSLKAAQGKLVNKQALFGIVQGGVYKDLREESTKFISALAFDGIAIGGVAVGESKEEMLKVLDWVIPLLPEDKPRHLLGVGEVDDIFEIIKRGVDTFDCVIPTRLGRTGFIFVSPPEGNIKNRFRVDVQKKVWQSSKTPLDKDCRCYVCQNFTRGYVNHLFRAGELLAYRLATYHNLYFVINLVKKIRESILEGRFEKLEKEWIKS